jgi:hypothetical protein
LKKSILGQRAKIEKGTHTDMRRANTHTHTHTHTHTLASGGDWKVLRLVSGGGGRGGYCY